MLDSIIAIIITLGNAPSTPDPFMNCQPDALMRVGFALFKILSAVVFFQPNSFEMSQK